MGAAARDAATVDEIAARIWYTLVRDDFRLLAAFDGSRDVRLNTFLAGLARIEILRFFRAERRRQTHECRGGRRLLRMRRATVNFDSVMREFAATLTGRTRVARIGPDAARRAKLTPALPIFPSRQSIAAATAFASSSAVLGE